MSLTVGARVGPYDVLAPLGAGGMGEVYRARDKRLERDVAIKVLPAAFASDRDRVARFEREAKAIAALSHPNILAIFDTGTDAGQTFVVTELLDGETLRERLTSALPIRKAVDIAIQIARGLAAAHDKSIVHRDLKPENVFLTKDGQVKILDFGLARQISTNTGATETVSAMTDPGTVMGTVGYMAPEQVRGQNVDARTDLFALGAVLYEMLGGKRAFARDTAADTMFAIVKEDPPDLAATRTDLPPALDRIVRHCLEKSPTERFQTARDVAFALEALSGSGTAPSVRVATPDSPARRWLKPVAFAAATVALTILAFVLGRQTASTTSTVQWERKTYDRQAVFNARFMPDGKTIVFSTSVEGRTPDLWVLRSDTVLPQLIRSGTHLMSVSKDGQLLVQTNAVHVGMDRATGTAARMQDLDSAPRPLSTDLRAADFGPTAETLAVVRDVGGVDQLEYPEGTALYKTPGWVSNIRVSPDGSRVAFFDHAYRYDDRGWLKVATRGRPGEVTTLAGEFPGQTGLAWSPDGNTVLFTSAVGNEELPVRAADVAAPGQHRKVLQTAGLLAMQDVAPDGTWLVDTVNFRNGIMALTPGQLTERDLTYAGNTWNGFLSPRDANQFLFVEWAGAAGSNYGVALRNRDDKPIHLGDGNPCGLSPDGKWALAYLSSPLEVRVYSTDTSEQRTLKTAFEYFPATGLSWYPDSRAALVCGNERGQPSRCYRVAIDGSPATAVTPDGVTGGLVISDDRVLGRLKDGTFEIYPATPRSGPPEKTRGLTPDDLLVAWSAKDRRVYAGPPALPFKLDKVDIQTGQRQTVKTLGPPNRAGVLSVDYPITLVDDGKYYSYRYSQMLSTLYVVKGAAALVGSK